MIACGFCGGNISTKELEDRHAEICLSFRGAKDGTTQLGYTIASISIGVCLILLLWSEL